MTKSIAIEQEPAKIFPIVMFISGNTIGAGILALPVMLGLAGFFPAFLATCLLWMMMFFTGVVMVKENILQKKNVDLLSFYEITFGKPGKFIIVVCYLFLFYGLSIAYLSGATASIINLVPGNLPYYPVLLSVFTFLFFIVVKGTGSMLRKNQIMMIMLFVFFFLLIGRATMSFDPQNLLYTDWKFLPAAFPVLLCSFGFHNTIPIAAKALKGNSKKLIKALFFGTLIPFTLNILILFVVMGALSPTAGGKTSLLSAFKNGLPATVPLSLKFNSSFFTVIGLAFSILAIFTSYLAVSAGLLGFFKDMLSKVKRNFKYSEILLTFAIPLFFTIIGKNLFLKAINFAAGIGATIIFGIMPCILVIRKKSFRAKLIGTIVLLLFLSIFLIELGQQLGLFKILPKIF